MIKPHLKHFFLNNRYFNYFLIYIAEKIIQFEMRFFMRIESTVI